MQSFDLRQRDVGDGYWEISVIGELDLAVIGRLEQAIDAVDQGYGGLVVGLADCEFIDSTGIAAILRAHQRFAEEGRRLVVCCPVGQTERVLEITGLVDNGLVFDSLEEAIAGRANGDE